MKKTARGPKNSNSHSEQLYNQTCGISNTVINTLSPRFDRQTFRLRYLGTVFAHVALISRYKEAEVLEKVFYTMTWVKMVVTDTCCRSAFLRSSSSRKRRFLLEPCRCCLKALACVTAARPFRRTSECHSHFHLIIRARNASTAVRPDCRRHNKSPLENANDQPPVWI